MLPNREVCAHIYGPRVRMRDTVTYMHNRPFLRHTEKESPAPVHSCSNLSGASSYI